MLYSRIIAINMYFGQDSGHDALQEHSKARNKIE